MRIKTILFDLGYTLLYSKDPWPPIYKKADLELLRVIRDAGIDLNPVDLRRNTGSFLEAYYAERGSSLIEKTTLVSLSDLLGSKGHSKVPVAILRAALDGMYAVTQKNWYLEQDALATLKTLRMQGYQLGIVSNTSDDKNVQQLIDRWALRSYFDGIITSAGCGFRKPDERIFRIALENLKFQANQTVMVGDTLDADISGANHAGLLSIWITRRTSLPSKGSPEIRPKAVVSKLRQIPEVLKKLEIGSSAGLA